MNFEEQKTIFERLKEVDLSNNGISKFPKSLILEKLKILKLASNKISNTKSFG